MNNEYRKNIIKFCNKKKIQILVDTESIDFFEEIFLYKNKKLFAIPII